jgi:hypothetical protein
MCPSVSRAVTQRRGQQWPPRRSRGACRDDGAGMSAGALAGEKICSLRFAGRFLADGHCPRCIAAFKTATWRCSASGSGRCWPCSPEAVSARAFSCSPASFRRPAVHGWYWRLRTCVGGGPNPSPICASFMSALHRRLDPGFALTEPVWCALGDWRFPATGAPAGEADEGFSPGGCTRLRSCPTACRWITSIRMPLAPSGQGPFRACSIKRGRCRASSTN